MRNARAADVATLTQGRSAEPVHMVELPPTRPAPAAGLPTLVPTGVGFMKNAGLVTEGRPDEFEALAGRCAVFRFESAR